MPEDKSIIGVLGTIADTVNSDKDTKARARLAKRTSPAPAKKLEFSFSDPLQGVDLDKSFKKASDPGRAFLKPERQAAAQPEELPHEIKNLGFGFDQVPDPMSLNDALGNIASSLNIGKGEAYGAPGDPGRAFLKEDNVPTKTDTAIHDSTSVAGVLARYDLIKHGYVTKGFVSDPEREQLRRKLLSYMADSGLDHVHPGMAEDVLRQAASKYKPSEGFAQVLAGVDSQIASRPLPSSGTMAQSQTVTPHSEAEARELEKYGTGTNRGLVGEGVSPLLHSVGEGLYQATKLTNPAFHSEALQNMVDQGDTLGIQDVLPAYQKAWKGVDDTESGRILRFVTGVAPYFIPVVGHAGFVEGLATGASQGATEGQEWYPGGGKKTGVEGALAGAVNGYFPTSEIWKIGDPNADWVDKTIGVLSLGLGGAAAFHAGEGIVKAVDGRVSAVKDFVTERKATAEIKSKVPDISDADAKYVAKVYVKTKKLYREVVDNMFVNAKRFSAEKLNGAINDLKSHIEEHRPLMEDLFDRFTSRFTRGQTELPAKPGQTAEPTSPATGPIAPEPPVTPDTPASRTPEQLARDLGADGEVTIFKHEGGTDLSFVQRLLATGEYQAEQTPSGDLRVYRVAPAAQPDQQSEPQVQPEQEPTSVEPEKAADQNNVTEDLPAKEGDSPIKGREYPQGVEITGVDEHGNAVGSANPLAINVLKGIQYKEDVTDEDTQTTSKYRGVQSFDPVQAGHILVWRRNDGKLFVAHGHHRLELARRAPKVQTIGTSGSLEDAPRKVQIRILDEADGWTLNDVRVRGAIENLRNGDGTAYDAAKVLKELKLRAEDLSKYGIQVKGNMQRDTAGLMRLSPEAMELVRRKQVPEQMAAGIGSVDGIPESMQARALVESDASGARSYDEGASFGKIFRQGLVNQGATQDDMFGGELSDTHVSTTKEQFEIQNAVSKDVLDNWDLYKKGLNFKPVTDKEVVDVEAREEYIKQFGAKKAEVAESLKLIFDGRHSDINELRATLGKAVSSGTMSKSDATNKLKEAVLEKFKLPFRDRVSGTKNQPPRREEDSGGNQGVDRGGGGGEQDSTPATKPEQKPEVDEFGYTPDEVKLYDEYQAILKSLPRNIGKAKQSGNWTDDQERRLKRADEIAETIGFQKLADRADGLNNKARGEENERAKSKRAESVKQLESQGWREGDTMHFAPSAVTMFSGDKGRTGVLKIGKHGNVYVSAQGGPFDTAGWTNVSARERDKAGQQQPSLSTKPEPSTDEDLLSSLAEDPEIAAALALLDKAKQDGRISERAVKYDPYGKNSPELVGKAVERWQGETALKVGARRLGGGLFAFPNTPEGRSHMSQLGIAVDRAATREENLRTARREGLGEGTDSGLFDAETGTQANNFAGNEEPTQETLFESKPLQYTITYEGVEHSHAIRKGTNKVQRENARQLVKGLHGTKATVLARAFGEMVAKEGGASLVGLPLESHADLASAAQILRDYRWETFRIVLVKNSRITSVVSLSNRLPGMTHVVPKGEASIGSYLDRLLAENEADSFYVLHNHPSGDPTPSPEDISITRWLGQEKVFKGHVVIDDNRYAFINPAGQTSQAQIKSPAFPSSANPHKVIGKDVLSIDDVVSVGKQFEKPDNAIFVGVDSKAKTRIVFSVPLAELSRFFGGMRGAARLSRIRRQNGLAFLHVVFPDAESAAQHLPRMNTLQHEGLLEDTVANTPTGPVSIWDRYGSSGKVMGRDLDKIESSNIVREPDGDYGIPEIPGLDEDVNKAMWKVASALYGKGVTDVTKLAGMMKQVAGNVGAMYANAVAPTLKARAETLPSQTGQADPHLSLVDKLAARIGYLGERGSISWREIEEMAESAFGGSRAAGKFDARDMYDSLETAVNRVIERQFDRISKQDPEAQLAWYQRLIGKLPTQTTRSEVQNKFQQFSTVWTEAYAASTALGNVKGLRALEPSAGTGNLAGMLRNGGATVVTNEHPAHEADLRAKLLKAQGFEVKRVDAERIDAFLPNEKFDVVLMNPPFSATGGRTKNNKTEYGASHVESALRLLVPGGRLVAIVGRGMGSRTPQFMDWFRSMERAGFVLRADLLIDGSEYKKLGTDFDNRILVFDRAGEEGVPAGTFQVDTPIPVDRALDILKELGDERATQRTSSVHSTGTSLPENTSEKQPASGSGDRQPDLVTGGGMEPGQRPTGDAGSGGARPAGGGRTGVEPVGDGLEGTGTVGPTPLRLEGTEGPVENEPSPSTSAVGGSDSGLGSSSVPPADVPRLEVASSEHDPNKDEGSFTVYKPAVDFNVPHPTELAETVSMAGVKSPLARMGPTQLANLVSAKYLLTEGNLSDAQLEPVLLAAMRHEQRLPSGERAGIYIGDGMGVGKGREASAIAANTIAAARKAGVKRIVWFSVNHRDLASAAERDLTDVMGDRRPAIKTIDDYGPAARISLDEGVMIYGYPTLARHDNRLSQLVDWLQDDPGGGLIMFDEAHKAANASPSMGKPSKSGERVVKLQELLPDARIVYMSATGATNPNEMAYLTRMGLWGEGTPFPNFNSFSGFVSRGGLGAMEMVAREMKALGGYVSRTIPFKHPDGSPLEFTEHKVEVAPEMKDVLDKASAAWRKALAAVEEFLTDVSPFQKSNFRSQYWGAHQRFFRSLYTAMKVPTVIQKAEADIAAGRQVIIALDSTNESAMDRKVSEGLAEGLDLSEINFSNGDALIRLLKDKFPVQMVQDVTNDTGTTTKVPVWQNTDGRTELSQSKPPGEGWSPVMDPVLVEARDAIIEEIGELEVPGNPLDLIINHFGKDNVAELTGRNVQVLYGKDGNIQIKKRGKPKGGGRSVNDYETQQFQDGNRQVAIVSRAAAQGISLHADRRAKSQVQRVMYLLELGWQTKEEIQKLGRAHRTGQVIGPEYGLMALDVAGEVRFMSALASRIASMGAIQKGDRKSSNAGALEQYDFNSPQGAAAVRAVLSMYPDNTQMMGLLDDNGALKIPQATEPMLGAFFNRLMVLPVDNQNQMFDSFMTTFETLVENAKDAGDFGAAILDLPAKSTTVEERHVVQTDEASGAETVYTRVKGEFATTRLDFKEARRKLARLNGRFALNTKGAIGVQFFTNPLEGGDPKHKFLTIKGDTRTMTADAARKYRSMSVVEAEAEWDKQLAELPETEFKDVHLLSGIVIPFIDRLQGDNHIVRVPMPDGSRQVGVALDEAFLHQNLQSIGVGRGQVEGPQAVFSQLMSMPVTESVRLAGGLVLRRRTFRGNPSVQIETAQGQTPSGTLLDRLKQIGLIALPVSAFDNRLGIPTDPDTGPDVVGKLLNAFPRISDEADLESPVIKGSLPGNRISPAPLSGGSKKLGDIVLDVKKAFPRQVTGSSKPGTLGVYLPSSRTRFIRGTTNLPTIGHELAHYIDDRFRLFEEWAGQDVTPFDDELNDTLFQSTTRSGMEPWRVRAEQFAEFVLAWLLNPDAARQRAPKLFDLMEEKVSGLALAHMRMFGQAMRQFVGDDPLGQVAAGFRSSTGTSKPPYLEWLDSLKAKYESLVQTSSDNGEFRTRGIDVVRQNATTDFYAPLVSAIREAFARQGIEKGQGQDLLPEGIAETDNPYPWLRLLSYTDNMTQEAIRFGAMDFRGNIVGPSLSDVFGKLDNSSRKAFEKDKDDLFSLMYSERHLHERQKLVERAELRAEQFETTALARAEIMADDFETDIDKKAAQIKLERRQGIADQTNAQIRELRRQGVPESSPAIEDALALADKTMKQSDERVDNLAQRMKGRARVRLVKSAQARAAKARQRLLSAAEAQSERLGLVNTGGGLISATDTAEKAINQLQGDMERYYRLVEAAEKIRAIGAAHIELLHDAGIYNREQADRLIEEHPYWISARREMGEGSENFRSSVGAVARHDKVIRQFKGSQRMKQDPFGSLLDTMHRVHQEAVRNMVVKNFTGLLGTERDAVYSEGADTGDIAVRLPAGAKPTDRTIVVFRNGEKEQWHIPDKVLYETLSKGVVNPLRMNPVVALMVGILGLPAKVIRTTVTRVPMFAARNLGHDTVNRLTVSNQPLNVKDFQALWKDPHHESYDRFGVGLSRLEDISSEGGWRRVQRRALQEALESGGSYAKWTGKVWKTIKGAAGWYDELLQNSERINRSAEMSSASRHAREKMGRGSFDAMLYGATVAREVGTDFRRASVLSKFANEFIPFFNPAIQGVSAFGTNFAKNPKRNIGRLIAIAGTFVLLQRLWAMLTDSDDERRNRSERQRMAYGQFKVGDDQYLLVPFGREVGVLVAAIDHAIDQASGGYEEFEGFFSTMLSTASPISDVTDFLGGWSAWFEAGANRDLRYSKDIVPFYEESLPLDERKGTEHASPLGQALQQVFNTDARLIDHVIEGQFGYLGGYATGLSEMAAGNPRGVVKSSEIVGLYPATLYGNRHVQWVLQAAKEAGIQKNPLRDLFDVYFESDNGTDRQQAARDAIAAAIELRQSVSDATENLTGDDRKAAIRRVLSR